MRSVHGTFATLLLMVPVLSIPALAIFGIPQFAPVVASPLDEGPRQDRERRVGQSARQSDDNLDDLEDAPSFGDDARSGRLGDSVPLKKPGRSAPDRNSFPQVDPRKPTRQPKSQKSRWMDESSGGDHGSPEFDAAPLRLADASETTDRRLDSRAAVSFDAPENAPRNPNPTDRRDFQRNPPSEPGGNSRNNPADSESLTWKKAVQRLNEMEIRNFRLQPGHRENQFMFICSYTPSDSPRVSYRFEAEADEPLKAVEKVLDQILEWQQRR